MAAPDSQTPGEPVRLTEYGIPIRNLWHMLLYAWDVLPRNALHSWIMTGTESAPTLDALLASMLVELMRGRLRIGLGGNYVKGEGPLQAVRGRIDFSESLKQRTFERGEAYCEFQTYNANEPRNQIIRTTLARLAQAGKFGPETDATKALRHNLRRLARDLDGVDLIELSLDNIHRQLRGRSDNDYRLMLAICQLVLRRQMPMESEGSTALPRMDRDALVLHHIYERFVANFYRMHLSGWTVAAQQRLEWHEKFTSQYLPSMVPDLVLQNKSSGQLIVLDTKFTAHSLAENQWGKAVFDSSHLYQLYAYLRSQEHLSEAHRGAAGILLYPAVHDTLSERIELQNHVIRVECVDLSASWPDVEAALINLIENGGL